MCYTISFLSRNIDLEFNFLYLFKMFRRKSKREKNSISIVWWSLDCCFYFFFRRCRRFVEFACCANSFHFSKWKSSVTPIFGIGKTFKFEYNGWVEKGDEEEEKISKWAFGNFGWKRFMLFLLFLFGYERKWKEKTKGEENMSYGWVKQGLNSRKKSFICNSEKSSLLGSFIFRRKWVEKVKWKGKPLKIILNRFGNDVYKYCRKISMLFIEEKENLFHFPFAWKVSPPEKYYFFLISWRAKSCKIVQHWSLHRKIFFHFVTFRLYSCWLCDELNRENTPRLTQ